MISIWAQSFLVATRQDRRHEDFRWAAPDHWRQDTRISSAERRARRD